MRPALVTAVVAAALAWVPLEVHGAGSPAAEPFDAHPGPAPLDPYPAGPLVAQGVSTSVMLFHVQPPREDVARALGDLVRRRFPELEPVAGGGGRARGPRLSSGAVDVQPPDRESVRTGSRDVTPADQESVRRCRSAFTIGVVSGPDGWLRSLRRIERLVHELAGRTGALIWDPQTRELFTASSFARRRLAAWSGDRPLVRGHLSLRSSPAGEPVRSTTRGMASFGLPDVLVAGVPEALATRAESLLITAADALVASPRLERTGELRLEPWASRDPAVRRLITDARGRRPIVLRIRVGERTRVDRNRLLEILPDPAWPSLLDVFPASGGSP